MSWIWLVIFVVALLFVLYFIFADADLTLLFHHTFSEKTGFKDKVIWITGASSGIGEHLSYELAKGGSKLALSGTRIEQLETVRRNCIEIGHLSEDDVLLVPFEIQKFELHDGCLQKVLDHFGHIDILVNNAGISQRADFQDIEIDVDLHLFNVNVFGLVNLSRKVLKHFLERKKGHFVVTSSTAGKIGAPFSSSYTGSKHALQGYFECLRSEMAQEKDIHITMVCPGPVVSNIINRCSTDKIGKKYDFESKPTDKRMKTERCATLMATAIAKKLDECWISIQPVLILYYLAQYIPSIYRNYILKVFFTKRMIMKVREGR